MEPTTQQIEAAVAAEPGNASLRYLMAADRASQGRYEDALMEFRATLKLDPALHVARFQLGLLQLTMARPDDALGTWAPLEQLPTDAPLRHFRRGLEALIRDDFPGCIESLESGIRLNRENAPLNRDMAMVIERARTAMNGGPGDTSTSANPSSVSQRDLSIYRSNDD
jgi:tetratricopeptide (TPR) repeat protein